MTQTKLLWDKKSQSRVWGGSPTSVFAARRDAKIASVATLALLAVSASPGNPSDNFIRGIQAQMLTTIFKIDNGTRCTINELRKVFLCPTFDFSFALDLPA